MKVIVVLEEVWRRRLPTDIDPATFEEWAGQPLRHADPETVTAFLRAGDWNAGDLDSYPYPGQHDDDEYIDSKIITTRWEAE